VEIIVFGQLTDITGSASLQVEATADTDTLLRTLQRRYPQLTSSKYVVAVNKKIITANTAVSDADTIALLPPFSGG